MFDLNGTSARVVSSTTRLTLVDVAGRFETLQWSFTVESSPNLLPTSEFCARGTVFCQLGDQHTIILTEDQNLAFELTNPSQGLDMTHAHIKIQNISGATLFETSWTGALATVYIDASTIASMPLGRLALTMEIQDEFQRTSVHGFTLIRDVDPPRVQVSGSLNESSLSVCPLCEFEMKLHANIEDSSDVIISGLSNVEITIIEHRLIQILGSSNVSELPVGQSSVADFEVAIETSAGRTFRYTYNLDVLPVLTRKHCSRRFQRRHRSLHPRIKSHVWCRRPLPTRRQHVAKHPGVYRARPYLNKPEHGRRGSEWLDNSALGGVE